MSEKNESCKELPLLAMAKESSCELPRVSFASSESEILVEAKSEITDDCFCDDCWELLEILDATVWVLFSSIFS